MTDLHIHTRLSFDSKEAPENYIAAARGRGDGTIGFSEHCDFGVYEGGLECVPDFEAYDKKVRSLNESLDGVKALKGIELGYTAEALPNLRGLLKNQRFDYAILSVHCADGRGDCYYPQFYERLTRRAAYSKYLKAVLDSVNADLDVQIVGHIGYVARYAPYAEKRVVYKEFKDIIDEILRVIIARGLCLELNTSTGGFSDFVPGTDVADRYIGLGGKYFSFGSDAHSTARYAENAELVGKYLLSRGIDSVYRFENAKKIAEKILT